ncbi:hypothetical protein CL634_10165, partial [bacterium]|nr:hypothetical protein [bacterium]
NNNVILDLMIHDVDIIRFLFGNVDMKRGINRIFKERGGTVYALFSFLYKDIVFSLESSWISPEKRRVIKILTPNTRYECDLIAQTIRKRSKLGIQDSLIIKKKQPLEEEIFNFIKFINNEPHEKCTLEESIKNLEIVCEHE